MSQKNRQGRASIAQETLQIIERGYYSTPQQSKVRIENTLQQAIEGTELFTPSDLDEVLSRARKHISQLPETNASIEVTPETTLAAARRLLREGHEGVMCLNFASAKNPGGGFLGGSQAQEESLARASGLYACISPVDGYYQTHRKQKSTFYTDHMIFSPQVPVFRDDEDRLLDEPYLATMITSPAVNRGAIEQNEYSKRNQIDAVMSERIEKLLALCVEKQQKTLVLGAWGCGVFRNDPTQMASWFHNHLFSNLYARAFEKITFAVFDNSKQQVVLRPFQRAFAHAS